jgi:hypothetical protein
MLVEVLVGVQKRTKKKLKKKLLFIIVIKYPAQPVTVDGQFGRLLMTTLLEECNGELTELGCPYIIFYDNIIFSGDQNY